MSELQSCEREPLRHRHSKSKSPELSHQTTKILSPTVTHGLHPACVNRSPRRAVATQPLAARLEQKKQPRPQVQFRDRSSGDEIRPSALTHGRQPAAHVLTLKTPVAFKSRVGVGLSN